MTCSLSTFRVVCCARLFHVLHSQELHDGLIMMICSFLLRHHQRQPCVLRKMALIMPGRRFSSATAPIATHGRTTPPPLYRLVYFDSRGAAELTRYLLAVVEAPYDDVRFPLRATAQDFGIGSSDDFVRHQRAGAFAANCNQLPVLQVLTADGQAAVATLGQSHAINRFLAERHGAFGRTSVERAQMDAVYEAVRDIKSEFLRVKRDTPAGRMKWVTKKLPEHLQTLEASLPPIRRRAANDDSGNNPSWLFEGKQPSLADVAVYALVGKAASTSTGSIVTGLDDLDPTPTLTDCPRLSAAVRAMDALPAVQSWHARRPDTFS